MISNCQNSNYHLAHSPMYQISFDNNLNPKTNLQIEIELLNLTLESQN